MSETTETAPKLENITYRDNAEINLLEVEQALTLATALFKLNPHRGRDLEADIQISKAQAATRRALESIRKAKYEVVTVKRGFNLVAALVCIVLLGIVARLVMVPVVCR